MKKKRSKRRGLIITISSIIGFILTILIVNQITVYPYIMTMRTLVNVSGTAVKIGPYADQIKDIEQSEMVNLKVEGYPDAGLLFFNQKNIQDKKPVILLIHGGGWSLGSAKSISPFAKLLASNGYVVASLEYSLAPQHKYPASTIQAIEAINYIYENAENYNIDNRNIFVGGNSA